MAVILYCQEKIDGFLFVKALLDIRFLKEIPVISIV